MHVAGKPGPNPSDRRAELLVEIHGQLAERLAELQRTVPARAETRRTSATLVQALGLVSLCSTLFVVPAFPLGLAAILLGIRLRRRLRATGQPTRPADTAITLGTVALIIAGGLLWYLLRHAAFY